MKVRPKPEELLLAAERENRFFFPGFSFWVLSSSVFGTDSAILPTCLVVQKFLLVNKKLRMFFF